jgi:hypothetical protein
VLSVEGDKALLITESVVEKRAYNDELIAITWENCTLRKYLNGDFYNSFSASDKKLILITHLVNHDSLFGTEGGNDTDDYIFLLGMDGAFQYLRSDDDPRETEVITQWLRTPGETADRASVFYGFGDSIGFIVSDHYGVRPALYINLK